MSRVLDLLTPEHREATEQRRQDRRFLAFCDYGGMTTIRGELPSIDGAAVRSAIRALAESLRAEGDGLTRGQRYADALMTLVNSAAAHGDLPASGSGLPVAASITISLTEAERLITGDRPGHRATTTCGGAPDTGTGTATRTGAGAGTGTATAAGAGAATGTGTATRTGTATGAGNGTGTGNGAGAVGVGAVGGVAHVPESDTTLGDAAARFALCCADLTGVIVTHPTGRAPTGTAGTGTLPGGTGHTDARCGGSHPAGATSTGTSATDTPAMGATPTSITPLAAALAATRLEPLAVGRSTRLATKAQRTALAIRDGGCVIPGCERPPAECQTHHVTDWSAGGATDSENLAMLCWSHHRQVDLHRWRLVRNPDPAGPFWLVTPIRRHAWRDRHAVTAGSATRGP